MNGGAIIAEMLRREGVRHLFTLSGGHIAPIYVEAERAGIQVIDVRHEATAVFAADALARLSGVPGVAAVTAGPGVTNTVTALKNAQLAQSPLVLFGGATATLLRRRGALQDIDQISIVQSLVKWGIQVKRLRELAAAVADGFRQARQGAPGPVFIEVPVDLLYAEETVREWYGQKNEPGRRPGARLLYWYINRHVNRLFQGVGALPERRARVALWPRFEGRDIRRTLQALRDARKPVILLGSGALQEPEHSAELASALRRLGVPVYLSGMARGLLGRQDPLQCLHQRKKALREADCILLAGVPADFRLDYGRQLNRKARILTVNRDKKDLRLNMPRTWMSEQTDPAHFLIALANAAGELPQWTDWKAQLAALQAAREQEIDAMAAAPLEGINPVALFRAMEADLPDNSVLVADGGDFAATASYTLRPRAPLHWLDPGAFGTLGVGGGFALGAALHYPDDYVWIIYGDGSAAYSLAEFDVFVRNGLKVCAIIGNNGSWEQIARDQRPMLGAATATELAFSDYQHVGAAFGAAGERVEDLEGFRAAMRRAIAHMDAGTPYVINAVVGKSEFRKGSISM